MTRPAPVVIASRLFPPEPGAAAYRLGALARALCSRDVPVDVVTTRPPVGSAAPTDPPGTRVRRWPVLRDAGGNVRGYVQFASFDGPLLLRLLFHRRPAAVVVEPPPTTGTVVRLVSMLRRVPYLYYAGDVSSTAARGIGVSPLVVRVLTAVEGWAMSGAAEVLAVSDGVADEVRRLTRGRVPVTTVGTGVDTDVFHPCPSATAAGRTLVYAGTMSEIHGAEVFVRAFAEVADEFPDSTLVMYGQGAEEQTLRSLAQSLAPGRVEFRGMVSGSEVAQAFSTAQAGLASLHPRVGYDYAFPTKMFAATACGAPVVYAGPGPGRAMVTDHRLGWACDWDVEQTTAALRSALSAEITPAERERLAVWTLENASQRAVAAAAADAVTRHLRR
ncbi:Glycosyltransferase involved in cell wall bisynthesis [Pedococcus cremeus]|uniref:D-inositol 3-phosphate glycosyltransferase n=1 Tax=Pedococcus cremeus TaxID=587636 RepID=A0A1H9XA84_9MICO|nr:glycosyltransferase family 4 protein [Pedococcus cremeus]SES42971.1 Glycosyltransferase involved in cell wall bisynthesis [Pedococcus cremeus]